jgi:putative flippase GtrA
VTQQHFAQLRRFLSVGLLNMAVGLLVIFACKWFLRFDDVTANAIGYAVGLTTSFTLNSRWTFGYRGRQMPALIRFLLVAALAYALNLVTVVFLVHVAGVNGYLAQALGIAPYTLTTYLASRYVVFRTDVTAQLKEP